MRVAAGIHRQPAADRSHAVGSASALARRDRVDSGQFDAALDAVRRSIDGYEVLRVSCPMSPDITANLGESYPLLGRVLQQKASSRQRSPHCKIAQHPDAAAHRGSPSQPPVHAAGVELSDHRADPSAAWRTGSCAKLPDQRRSARPASHRGVAAHRAGRRGAQVLLELGRKEEARPLVEHLVALGWHNDGAHRDFAQLVVPTPRDPALP